MGNKCFHCGLDIIPCDEIFFDNRSFCCKGCKTVYDIFSSNGLSSYYDLEKSPGATPLMENGKYDFLDNEKIAATLLDFSEGDTQIISLHIPHIHCSSCIWILENLRRIKPEILSSQVTFHEKKVRITFNSSEISLKEVVLLLCSIGYEPYISLEDYGNTAAKTDRSLTYKLGVAFFCFGNIMLLSFPEYFEHKEFWLDQYRGFFRWLIFALALPSFFYSANGYYIAAISSIRAGRLNIEIPIALGIVVMFIRSTADLLMDHGPGFFDSMTGLIFFMLLGKMFQMKTYRFLNFERDFKSYFPIAVTRIIANGAEENVPVYEIAKGDRLLIRNFEIIPADGILISNSATIDYSFVTGEAVPVSKLSGDKVFAGGRQIGGAIEMETIQTVSQSYLTQLWSNEIFQKENMQRYRNITDTMSRYFTPVLLLIAFAGFGWWIFKDTDIAFNVFTAVLIVACPCALALTAPFTLGNVIRLMGKSKYYLKNTQVIEQMAKVDTIVFDKTGTITTGSKSAITYDGQVITTQQRVWIKNVLRTSNHPLSRMLYDYFPENDKVTVTDFLETPGKGIAGVVSGHQIQIGSEAFTGQNGSSNILKTMVYVTIDDVRLGRFIFHNEYRPGLSGLFTSLQKKYTVKVLSGDNEGERAYLEKLLPGIELIFNKKPEEKLEFIKKLQQQGHNVMMVGDGLNDAGALAQSNVGIAVSENINVFSPACDAIVDAAELNRLDRFMVLSKKAMGTIYMSFGLSLLYNIIGLSFAVTGNLLPIMAAVIMPLSTITIISFVTVVSNFYARMLNVTHVREKSDGRHILSKQANLILTPKTTI